MLQSGYKVSASGRNSVKVLHRLGSCYSVGCPLSSICLYRQSHAWTRSIRPRVQDQGVSESRPRAGLVTDESSVVFCETHCHGHLPSPAWSPPRVFGCATCLPVGWFVMCFFRVFFPLSRTWWISKTPFHFDVSSTGFASPVFLAGQRVRSSGFLPWQCAVVGCAFLCQAGKARKIVSHCRAVNDVEGQTAFRGSRRSRHIAG